MTHIVRIDDLRSCATGVLVRLGHLESQSATISDLLVDSDLRGYPDHGVAMLGLMTVLPRLGQYNPRPTIRVVSETETTCLLDGDRGFGVVSGIQAMRWCIERAKERRGIACAAVRHASHVVASAPYVELAAREGLIGFSGVSANPAIAPPGGRDRVIGNDPLAFAAPAARHYPLIFDMSASATAALKMRMAALKGETVPEGLVLDAEGQPTTDPREFWPPTATRMIGSMLPVGWPLAAHKGFGLAMLVEVLAGVLTGGGFGQMADVAKADVGQFYWALDVRAFMPREEFEARVDALIDEIKASARVDGVEEIFVPGERSQRQRASLLAQGTVPLPEESWEQLGKACAVTGQALPTSDEVAGSPGDLAAA